MIPVPPQNYAAIAAALGVTHSRLLCKSLIAALRVHAGMIMLDVGAGACGDAAWIARSTGARVVCVDTSQDMLACSPGAVMPVRANALALPIGRGTIDGAYAVNLLQLIERPAALLHEVRRALRLGGRIALPVTSHERLATRFLNRFFPSLEAIEQRRFPPVQTLVQLLGDLGFKAASHTEIDLGYFTVDRAYVHRIRSGIFSGLNLLPVDERARGLDGLEDWVRRSEASGSWHQERRIRTMIVAEAA